MSSSNEIEEVNAKIRGMQIPRIIAFADVVNIYAQKILKNKLSWLRTNALIFLVTRGGTLTPGQLARIMLRSNYSITRLIDALEKDRLVMRYPDGKDRRSIKVKVTSEGLNFVISSLSDVAEAEHELKYWLNDDELENLATTIRKLRGKLIEKISERYSLSADDKTAIFKNAHPRATVKNS